jgi:hypothetical protein
MTDPAARLRPPDSHLGVPLAATSSSRISQYALIAIPAESIDDATLVDHRLGRHIQIRPYRLR